MNEQYLNCITTGNSLDLVDNLEDESVDSCVIDPPYGEGMGYSGDESIQCADNLLKSFLRVVYPKMKKNAHLAIFFTMRNVDVVIDAVRELGYNFVRVVPMYIPKGGARPYLGWLPRTQAIVIAQKYLPYPPRELHARLAEYLSEAVQRSGLSRSQIAASLGCNSRLVMKWTRVGDPAWCLPTPRFYAPLKALLNLDNTFDVMLEREVNSGNPDREDFEFKHDCYVVTEKREREPIHPSEKPVSVLTHVVSCLTPKGGVVLDGFSGSGSTAEAALQTGRNFIAFELSPDYAELSRNRLAK